MESFLRKLGLIDNLVIELKIQKTDFLNAFINHVDEGDIGLFSGAFDAFSSSKNEYRGRVTMDGFEIKRKRKLFDRSGSYAKAKGHFFQKGDTLIIETEINGFSKAIIPFYIFVLLFYCLFFFAFLFANAESDGSSFFPLPFLLLHASLMLGIPLFIMNRSVKRLKYDLERDFYYMTKPFPNRDQFF